jgi:hypothetical protein
MLSGWAVRGWSGRQPTHARLPPLLVRLLKIPSPEPNPALSGRLPPLPAPTNISIGETRFEPATSCLLSGRSLLVPKVSEKSTTPDIPEHPRADAK